jgi:hypothetical protein
MSSLVPAAAKPINELMDVLDDNQLIEAVDEVKMGDLKKKGSQDRSKINMHEPHEVSTGPKSSAWIRISFRS